MECEQLVALLRSLVHRYTARTVQQENSIALLSDVAVLRGSTFLKHLTLLCLVEIEQQQKTEPQYFDVVGKDLLQFLIHTLEHGREHGVHVAADNTILRKCSTMVAEFSLEVSQG